jgi:ribosomal protein S18 acetylase RimI-like enzyme
MAEMLTDTSPAGMRAAIGDVIETTFLLLATAPGGEARRTDGVTTAITGLPVSDFNGVFRTRLHPRLPSPEIDQRIAETLAYLRSRGVPFGWWRLPDDSPSDLHARLVATGLMPEGEQPAMAIDLEQPRPEPRMPKDVTVAEVTDQEGIGAHMRLAANGFGMPVEIEDAFRALVLALPYGPGTPLRYFLATERGEPIGTSLVVVSGGAAGIFNVATAPQARDRGVGTLVTDIALRVAREVGHRIAILETSSMGYHVYQRMGFGEYGTVGHYAWTGEADA